MSVANTSTSYGSVSRFFHWTTALLIILAFPLGVIANGLPFDTDAELARKAQLFSVHKTIGVTAFAVALARILWAVFQPRPAPLHPDRRAETALAETVHWLLYASMVIVPLSGWLHHAATSGFAPIWWPFGQTLPFVPQSEAVAKVFGAWHWVFTKVLLASILLHVAGALKHAVIDRDGTLARMVRGTAAGAADTAGGHRVPALAAAGVTAAAIAAGTAFGLPGPSDNADELAEVDSGWAVEEGTLGISIRQLGSPVEGSFSDWTAAIEFDPDAAGPVKGTVEVTVGIASLELGSVAGQAMGADFFDAETHPTAVFAADIRAVEADYIAEGTLTIKGISADVALPFALVIDGDRAVAEGAMTLDRRSFQIGESYSDEQSLGFPVEIAVSLAATRSQ